MSSIEFILFLLLYGYGVASLCVLTTQILNPRPFIFLRVVSELTLAASIAIAALWVIVGCRL